MDVERVNYVCVALEEIIDNSVLTSSSFYSIQTFGDNQL